MPFVHDMIPVGNAFSVGTTYSVAGGTLSDPIDNVQVDYNDIWHGDNFDFGASNANLVNSRYIEVDYYDSSGTLIGTSGPAYHLTFDDGSSYLMLTDSNPYKDLQGIASIEVTYVDTSTTIHQMLTSEFDDDDDVAVVCFAAGTMLETGEGGGKPVEDIRIGDRIWTQGNASEPVTEIIRIGFSARDLRRNRRAWPVEFLPGSLAPGVPSRAMRLSQQHRVLVSSASIALYLWHDQLLVAAKHLVNGNTIRLICPKEGVAYYHIGFREHEIVCSDGALTESLLDASEFAASGQGGRSSRRTLAAQVPTRLERKLLRRLMREAETVT